MEAGVPLQCQYILHHNPAEIFILITTDKNKNYTV